MTLIPENQAASAAAVATTTKGASTCDAVIVFAFPPRSRPAGSFRIIGSPGQPDAARLAESERASLARLADPLPGGRCHA